MPEGMSKIDRLSASSLELSPGLLDLQFGINASSKSALDQFQGLLILRYGRVQKLLLGVQEAGLIVEQCQLRMHRQVDGCQVGGAGLGLVAIRFDGAAYASPSVDLVRPFEGKLYVGEGNAIECWAAGLPIHGIIVAGYRRIDGQGWEVIGPLISEHCASLGICGLGGFHILVGDVYLLFEYVQLRVLKYLPPVAAGILIVRLGRFPIAHFLIGRRNFRRGAFIIWSNGAARKQSRAQHAHTAGDALADSDFQLRRGESTHWVAAEGAAGGVPVGLPICIVSPSTVE